MALRLPFEAAYQGKGVLKPLLRQGCGGGHAIEPRFDRGPFWIQDTIPCISGINEGDALSFQVAEGLAIRAR